MDAVAITDDGSVVRTSRRSRRWRIIALALVLGAIAISILNSIDLAAAHELEVRSRPDPPFGQWAIRSAWEIGRVGLNAMGLATVAALPGLVLVALLGRRAGVSASRVAAAALVSLVLFSLNSGRIQVTVRGLTGMAPPDHTNVSSVVLTPIVEEFLMLLAVLIVLRAATPRSGARAGLVLGLAAGIGATITEAALYIQLNLITVDDPLYGDVIGLRFALLGLNLHATTVALSGAALGAWLDPPIRLRRIWIPVLGFAAAVAIHGLWNLYASGIATKVVSAITSPSDPTGALTGLVIAGTLTSAVLLVVPWIVLAVIWRRTARGVRPDGRPAAEAPGEAAVPVAAG